MDVTTDDCFSDMLKVHFHSWPDLPKVTRSALECKSPTAQLNSSSSPASPASHGRRVAHGNFLFFIFQTSLTKYFIFYTSDEKRTMHWNFSIQFYNISWDNTSISFYCLCLDNKNRNIKHTKAGLMDEKHKIPMCNSPFMRYAVDAGELEAFSCAVGDLYSNAEWVTLGSQVMNGSELWACQRNNDSLLHPLWPERDPIGYNCWVINLTKVDDNAVIPMI